MDVRKRGVGIHISPQLPHMRRGEWMNNSVGSLGREEREISEAQLVRNEIKSDDGWDCQLSDRFSQSSLFAVVGWKGRRNIHQKRSEWLIEHCMTDSMSWARWKRNMPQNHFLSRILFRERSLSQLQAVKKSKVFNRRRFASHYKTLGLSRSISLPMSRVAEKKSAETSRYNSRRPIRLQRDGSASKLNFRGRVQVPFRHQKKCCLSLSVVRRMLDSAIRPQLTTL